MNTVATPQPTTKRERFKAWSKKTGARVKTVAGKIWPKFLLLLVFAFGIAAAYLFRLVDDWHYAYGGLTKAILPVSQSASVIPLRVPWKFVQEVDCATMANMSALCAALCVCLWCLHWYGKSERTYKETIALREVAFKSKPAPATGSPQAQGGTP